MAGRGVLRKDSKICYNTPKYNEDSSAWPMGPGRFMKGKRYKWTISRIRTEASTGRSRKTGTTRIDMPRRHRREEAPEDAPEREKRDVAGRIESVINKIKELLGRKSEKQVDEELFTERRGSRSFILELLFTVLKVMAVTVIIAGTAGLVSLPRSQGIHRDYRGHRSCTAHQERQDFLHIRQGRQAHNHLRRHGISGLGGYRRDTGYAQECPDFHRGRALLQA